MSKRDQHAPFDSCEDESPRGLQGWWYAAQATSLGLRLGACKRLGIGRTLSLPQLRVPASMLAATIVLSLALPLPRLVELVAVLVAATVLGFAWHVHAVHWRDDAYFAVEPLSGPPEPDRP